MVTRSSDYVTYHTYGEGDIFCPSAISSAEGTIDNPALIYYGTTDTSKGLVYGSIWTRWVIGSYGGSDAIDTLGGALIRYYI